MWFDPARGHTDDIRADEQSLGAALRPRRSEQRANILGPRAAAVDPAVLRDPGDSRGATHRG